MNAYLLLKLLHILAAFWFIAGILGRQLVRAVARRSEDIHHFAAISRLAGRFESLMVIPGNLLVIVFGVFVAWRGGWPILGFLQGSSSNWLLATNLLLLVGLAIVPTIYLPRGRLFDRALQEALEIGKNTPKLQAAMDDRQVKWAHGFEYASLLAIIFLMVAKPF
jgi:uncharacterized membrane protein